MWLIDKLFSTSPSASLQVPGESLQGQSTTPSPAHEESIPFNPSEPIIPDHYRPLIELQERRQLLEVRVGASNQVYQSMVLVVDIERELLWLDDLFPQERKLQIGDEICLRHHKQGEQLVIRSPIVALGENYGASGIAILIPEEIIYTPRRNAPRFSLGSQATIGVKIRTLGEEPCFGTLQDISTGGLRALIPGNILSSLRHGALVPLCEITLATNLNIRCRARICSFRTSRVPFRHTQLSVEFIDLDEDSRSLLKQFLQNISRTNTERKTEGAGYAAA